jgi:hypothetical protein
MCNLHKENFDSIVRLNQQWFEIFSEFFLGKVSQVKQKVQEEKEKQEEEQVNGKE